MKTIPDTRAVKQCLLCLDKHCVSSTVFPAAHNPQIISWRPQMKTIPDTRAVKQWIQATGAKSAAVVRPGRPRQQGYLGAL